MDISFDGLPNMPPGISSLPPRVSYSNGASDQNDLPPHPPLPLFDASEYGRRSLMATLKLPPGVDECAAAQVDRKADYGGSHDVLRE